MRALKIAALAGLLWILAPAPVAAQEAESTAFVEAVRKSDGNKVSELIGKRPVGLIDSRDYDGNTGLHIVLARRDTDWTAFLLTKGANPNIAGKNGERPLIIAARVGFDDAVDWLLEAGAKVDEDNRSGETALTVAVQQHRLAIVRSLLKAGASPDKTDFSGYSARDYAQRDPRARDILQLIQAKSPKPPAKP